MKVLLLGAAGQLGYDIQRTWTDHEVVALRHADCDVTDRAQVFATVAKHRPQLVIDNAAYVLVDNAESNPARAFAVNAEGAKNVADAACEVEAAMLYVSSDYVFGAGGEPHPEDEQVSPQGAYAISKAAGEALVRETSKRHFVVRSSGLYGITGSSGKIGNFVETILGLAREGQTLRVVDDQVVGPTYTLDLARKIAQVAAAGAYGCYHLVNQGHCSWYEFARAILKGAEMEADIRPITTTEYGAPGPRPAFSVLAETKLDRLGIQPMRPWPEALAAYLVEAGHRR
jgi:dTDP-4-dehydrorhamnose reductase